MSKPNYNQRCKICNSFIIYDDSKIELNGKHIPLDLNGKRHFCSSADMIEHEYKIVEQSKNYIEKINKTELSSLQLELHEIIDGVENAS